jgi:S-adenosylmethionine/arginine decarboxylase-like enzyme
MSWGYHLALDVGRCAPKSIRCAKQIETFTKQLVRDIDMVAYGEPQIVMFGTGNKKGYTLVQLIETSNICAHFVEETNDMYLDVFSCKDFDPKIVVSLIQGHFDPATIDGQFFLRTARFRDERGQIIRTKKPELV